MAVAASASATVVVVAVSAVYFASDAIFVFQIYRRRVLEFTDASHRRRLSPALVAFIARTLPRSVGGRKIPSGLADVEIPPCRVSAAINENYSVSRSRGRVAKAGPSGAILPRERTTSVNRVETWLVRAADAVDAGLFGATTISLSSAKSALRWRERKKER